MTTAAIPDWTTLGVLPPIDPLNPTSANRSPYRVSITDFVLRFATSSERCRIVDGLLRYRFALRELGLCTGFQWLDGSFLEDVETIQSRPPNDVDVVTFYHLPAGDSQHDIQTKSPELFDPGHVKSAYHVDAYVMHLGTAPRLLVRRSSYWYSLWSHRRNLAWKGFVEIDLDGNGDSDARALLSAQSSSGGNP